MPCDVNHAEMMAALNGVWLAVNVGGADAVLLQTDSLATIEAADGRHKKYRKWWREQLAANGLAHIRIRAKHVKGHTRCPAARSWANRWCDKEAVRLMREHGAR